MPAPLPPLLLANFEAREGGCVCWTLNNSEPGSAAAEGWASPLPKGWDSSAKICPHGRQRGHEAAEVQHPSGVGDGQSCFLRMAAQVHSVCTEQGCWGVASAFGHDTAPPALVAHRHQWSVLSVSQPLLHRPDSLSSSFLETAKLPSVLGQRRAGLYDGERLLIQLTLSSNCGLLELRPGREERKNPKRGQHVQPCVNGSTAKACSPHQDGGWEPPWGLQAEGERHQAHAQRQQPGRDPAYSSQPNPLCLSPSR